MEGSGWILEVACRMAGVSESSVKRWRRWLAHEPEKAALLDRAAAEIKDEGLPTGEDLRMAYCDLDLLVRDVAGQMQKLSATLEHAKAQANRLIAISVSLRLDVWDNL